MTKTIFLTTKTKHALKGDVNTNKEGKSWAKGQTWKQMDIYLVYLLQDVPKTSI